MSETISLDEIKAKFAAAEKEVSKEEWNRVHLEHFLVTHTIEYTDEIAEKLNQSRPEILYLEKFGGSNEWRKLLRDGLQIIADRTSEDWEYVKSIEAVQEAGLHDDFAFELVSKINFPTRIELVDVSEETQRLSPGGYVMPTSSIKPYQDFETCYDQFKQEARSIVSREWHIESQIENDLSATLRKTEAQGESIHAALVTGAAHTGVDLGLRDLGISLKRTFITSYNEADRAEEGEKVRFDSYLNALRQARFDYEDTDKAKDAFRREYVLFNLKARHKEEEKREQIDDLVNSMSPQELKDTSDFLDDLNKQAVEIIKKRKEAVEIIEDRLVGANSSSPKIVTD